MTTSTPRSTVRSTRKYLLAQQLEDRAAQKKLWRTATPLARAAWTKLSPQEIVTSEGNVHRLAGLIQLRYGVDREEADRQVATFLATLPAVT